MRERAWPRRAARRLAYWQRCARSYWCLRRAFTSFGPRAAIFGAVRFRVAGTATAGCFAAGAPARAIRNLDHAPDWVRR